MLLPATLEFVPPLGLICVMTNDDAVSSASASVSLSCTTPLPAEETVNVASSLTEPVSLVAAGVSFVPVTVIINVAVSVPPFPSETV